MKIESTTTDLTSEAIKALTEVCRPDESLSDAVLRIMKVLTELEIYEFIRELRVAESHELDQSVTTCLDTLILNLERLAPVFTYRNARNQVRDSRPNPTE